MIWKKHLPQNCPPDDAVETQGIVYRLVKQRSITPEDFLSYRELNPDKLYDLSECIVGGISIYTELEGVQKLQSKVPAMKKRKIAKGFLQPQHGKMKNTPSETHPSHNTWWIPLDEKPWEVFNVES